MTLAIRKKMVSAAAVAEELGLAGSTVRQYVREGRIPVSLKTPGGHARFDLDDVRVALASGTETHSVANHPIPRRSFRPLAEHGEVRVNLSEQPFVIAEDWQLAFGVAAASITTGDHGDDDVDPVVGVRGSGRFALERELVHA